MTRIEISQNLAQELARARVAAVGEEFRGRGVLHHDAAVGEVDLVGDLALVGAWPRCDVVAIKSGHELHASLARALRAKLRVASA